MGIGIPAEHSNLGDFECTDGHWAVYPIIQISDAQMGIRHFIGAFEFRMLKCALIIQAEHSDF